MVHTLKNLSDQVLNWLDEAGTTGTTRTNVRNAINLAHQQRLTEQAWPFMLWDGPVTFTTVVGQVNYSLHQEFHRPLSFFNNTRSCYLREVPVRNLVPDGVDFGVNVTGQNDFVLWTRLPVQNQPSSASVVTIVSSSSSDTGAAYQIVVKGETAEGIQAEAIYPNGTTPAAGTVSFTKILGVTKAQAWNGTMTMTSNSEAVTCLTLFDCEFGRSYPQLRFVTTPNAAETISYRFYRQPLVLVNDFDIPDIPAPYSQILVWEALKMLFVYDGQFDGPRAQAIQDNINKLTAQMESAFLDATSLNAETRYVRYIDPDATAPGFQLY